jgi:thiamine biosynthesis lipoprotein
VTVQTAAAAGPARTLHVEHCMGTAFTIDIRDPGQWQAATADVVAWLHRVDAVFSCYRLDSDISRIQRRELRAADADPDVLTVLDLCARVQLETDGAFSAMYHGRLDPTGLVKGWAIERASDRLRAHGSANHAVNGGGDMQLAGEAAPGRPWRVGISDPHLPDGIVTTVSGRDLAVATSGTSERGPHILDPVTGRAPNGLAAASVVGPSLTLADAYATAAFVMGEDALEWIDAIAGYSALLVGSDGRLLASRRWQAARSVR